MNTSLAFTRFNSETDTVPKAKNLPWQGFADALTKHTTRPVKAGAPCFSPVVYAPSAKRGNAGVQTITALAADFDGTAEPDAIADMLAGRGLAAVLYSSFSHTSDLPKFRAVIPLAAPVPVAEWEATAPRLLVGLFGTAADPACTDPARLFYVPTCPVARLAEAFAFTLDGDALDPETVATPDAERLAAWSARYARVWDKHDSRKKERAECGGNPPPKKEPRPGDAPGSVRPGDDYNRRGDLDALLRRHGWTECGRRGDVTDYTRPGKSGGVSGTLGFCETGSGDRKFYCFTDNAPPLADKTTLDGFGLFAALECGGDKHEAARRLAAEGFGEPAFTKASFAGDGDRGKGETNEANKKNKKNNVHNKGVFEEGGYRGEEEDNQNTTSKARYSFYSENTFDAEPIPFGTDNLPAFPLHALPPVLAKFAQGVAASVGTPLDLPAVQVLAAVAGTVQKRVRVCPKPGYVEPCTLWCISVAPPGSRKSAIMAQIRKPFAAFEVAENEKIMPRGVGHYESELRTTKKRLDKAEGCVANKPEDADALAELDAARDAMDALRLTRLLIDDATPESAAAIMSENGGRLAVLDAEGVVFGHMTGRYTDKPAIEVFLKSHSGETFTQDRAGKERRAVQVRNAALTLGVTIQPAILADLRKKRELVGVGALARCLFSLVADNGEGDSFATPRTDAGAETAYNALIGDLLTLSPTGDKDEVGEPLPYTCPLTAEALKMFTQFYAETRARIREQGGGSFAEWLAKLHGATLRLAGVLHMARHGKPGAEKPIDADTMQAAFALADYFREHSQAAFSQAGDDEATEGAKRIIAWVRRNRGTVKAANESGGVSANELRQQIRAFETAEELDAALAVLAERGYAAPVEPEEPEPGKRGRKPSPRWRFHPCLTEEPGEKPKQKEADPFAGWQAGETTESERQAENAAPDSEPEPTAPPASSFVPNERESAGPPAWCPPWQRPRPESSTEDAGFFDPFADADPAEGFPVL